LKHASEIEAMKLAQANIQKEMGSLASARSVNALWVVVSSIGLSLLAAVIKSIFNL
jgi:hypothetical protein